MMKNKIIILILLLVSALILRAQNPLMKQIERCSPKYRSEIRKKFDFAVEFKIMSQVYRHIELIPFLYLKNIELNQELLNSDELEKTVMEALKEQPTADNLKISVNYPHHAIIYNDNLQAMDDYDGYFCITPSHPDALIRYFKKFEPQLIFYIWGLNDLFVLIDNRIFKLLYNQKTDSFEKINL